MKKMHKMPDGKMMKDSDMDYGDESEKMEKMEYKKSGGYAKKMASGGSVTPRGFGQAKNKPCKIY